MTSDKLRFFKIGFLEAKELLLESRLASGVVFKLKALTLPVWRGPYNHVTSWSFILMKVSSCRQFMQARKAGLPIQRFGRDSLELIFGLCPRSRGPGAPDSPKDLDRPFPRNSLHRRMMEKQCPPLLSGIARLVISYLRGWMYRTAGLRIPGL